MRLIIIRHGETAHNVERVFSGSMEVPLTDKGVAQARMLAKRFEGEQITLAFSSDLSRAATTLQLALAEVSFIRTPLLRERSFGIFQGKSYETLDQAVEKPGFTVADYCPPGGESYADVEKRLRKFWVEYLAGFTGTAVVSAHGALNRSFLGLCLGLSYMEQHVLHQYNTCVNILEGELPGAFTPVCINCTEHLGAEYGKRT
jgi:broad specificity phosphatase PhoE